MSEEDVVEVGKNDVSIRAFDPSFDHNLLFCWRSRPAATARLF